ncbi:MAG: hypothetical protein AAF804_09835, partial [Bacteroidota bacterium]
MTSPIQGFFSKFDASPERGFVPTRLPLVQLPAEFDPWEELVQALPQAIAQGRVRQKVDALPLLTVETLDSLAQKERGMRLLCLIGHAFLHQDSHLPALIPRALSLPWLSLAEQIGRPPVINHASMMLHNWCPRDEVRPFSASNLKILDTFLQHPDEKWFYLVTLRIEVAGAAALRSLVQAWLAKPEGDEALLVNSLGKLPSQIQTLEKALQTMYQGCDPGFFYHQIRPLLNGIPGIKFESDPSGKPRAYVGGSAAQSSLLQALDAGLGIAHRSPFLRSMRAYMPPAHRQFIEALEDRPIAGWISKAEGRARAFFQESIEALHSFRQAHLALAATYITKQARLSGDGGK